MMRAIVLKTISEIAKKDAIFIKKGKYGILKGHDKRKYIENANFKTPNFYPWNQIKVMKTYFRIEND